jgi:hypothetical protein
MDYADEHGSGKHKEVKGKAEARNIEFHRSVFDFF